MSMIERDPGHPIDPLFVQRWSPRAFDAQPMPEGDLLTLMEAARWAPSAFNHQPWRFLYSLRGDAHWADFTGLLDEFNATWAWRASALVVVLSDMLMPGREPGRLVPAPTHSFDAGAAWAQLALQATRLGYHTHGMAGIDFDKARTVLRVPPRFRVEIAVAVGRQADPAVLPEALRPHEQPSRRHPLHDIAFTGPFPS